MICKGRISFDVIHSLGLYKGFDFFECSLQTDGGKFFLFVVSCFVVGEILDVLCSFCRGCW